VGGGRGGAGGLGAAWANRWRLVLSNALRDPWCSDCSSASALEDTLWSSADKSRNWSIVMTGLDHMVVKHAPDPRSESSGSSKAGERALCRLVYTCWSGCVPGMLLGLEADQVLPPAVLNF
jgi:hypothetical protein